MWSSGDTVVWRSLAFGRIRLAMPHVVVEQTSEQAVLWLPGGAPGKNFTGKPLGELASLGEADWSLQDKVWEGDGVLKVHRFGRHHSLWHFTEGWYVNLEEPWRPTPVGWDTRDLVLDIVVARDGSWRWKDEEYFSATVARGWITEQTAALVRAEGERVLEERPWPSGWEDWQPDPSWPIPELPEGWDAV